MSSPLSTTIILLSFILLLSPSQATSKTTTFFSPIKKDETTNFYTMLIYLKTPLQPSQLHLDLGSNLPWYDCSRHYKSSSYKPVIYNTSLCLDIHTNTYANCFNKPGPGCANDTCSYYPTNPVTRKGGTGQILTDKFALSSLKNPVQPVSDIVLSCTEPNEYSRIYRGLAKGSTGLAALGRFNYSLPAQISRATSSPRVFALCLPTSSNATGLVLFNSDGPYKFSNSKNDLSKSLIYTPLILGPREVENDVMYWYKSPDYYIGLTSFKVNGKSVPLNRTLLAVDENGFGGTRLSTSKPYSVLQSSIFEALRDAFMKESGALNLTVIKPVEPFEVCYGAERITSTTMGPRVPTIDLVLQSDEVYWRIYGSNSMVRIQSGNVDGWCLGFVDGGLEPKSSIVIGAHQFEDNLLQFDMERDRLGFSSSLLSRSTSCANFDPKN